MKKVIIGNLFELGAKQLVAERTNKITMGDIIDKAIVIRKWLDRHPKTGDMLLSGNKMSKQLKYYYKTSFKK